MSRIGKAPITIPAGVTVEISEGGEYGNQQIIVKGPKAELATAVRSGVKVKMENGIMEVARDNDIKQNRSFHGLYRALLANMVQGVTAGYKKELEIVGIGYRAEQQGNEIVFSLGYSHKIRLAPPTGITVTVQDQTQIAVEGADKQLVGEVAAKIRSFRKPEPYQGKGIRYKDEKVRRKSVKQG